ncbi:hypothetical protein [Methanolacinia petrolearia]|uniref:hypothetical protein n=1 Tax=Methanolacinia petrolearia TaxID=54120 RepID=UPI003BAC9324
MRPSVKILSRKLWKNMYAAITMIRNMKIFFAPGATRRVNFFRSTTMQYMIIRATIIAKRSPDWTFTGRSSR